MKEYLPFSQFCFKHPICYALLQGTLAFCTTLVFLKMLRNLIAAFRFAFIGIFVTCCGLFISTKLWKITLSSKDCLRQASSLKGRLLVDFRPKNISYHYSIVHNGQVRVGGWWLPKDCIPKKKVAVLVPYRNRPDQLQIFLNHMHPLLQRQRLAYRIFVVEQVWYFLL